MEVEHLTDDIKEIRKAILIATVIGVSITLTRLTIKVWSTINKTPGHIGRFRFWYSLKSTLVRVEDVLCLVAMIGQICQFVVFWSPWKIGSYYVRMMAFYIIIWCSRLGVLYPIVQAEKFYHKELLIGYSVVMVFLISQVVAICTLQVEWKSPTSETYAFAQCHLPHQVAISHYIADIAADGVLFYKVYDLAIKLRNKTTAPFDPDGHTKRGDIRLIFCYLFYLIASGFSIVHATFILRQGSGKNEILWSIYECGAALSAASLPVTGFFISDRVRKFMERISHSRDNSSVIFAHRPRSSDIDTLGANATNNTNDHDEGSGNTDVENIELSSLQSIDLNQGPPSPTDLNLEIPKINIDTTLGSGSGKGTESGNGEPQIGTEIPGLSPSTPGSSVGDHSEPNSNVGSTVSLIHRNGNKWRMDEAL